MRVMWPDILTEKAWFESKPRRASWLRFIHAIRTLFVTFTSALVAALEGAISKTSQNGVRLINGGFMATKHLDSWRAFTHLAVRRNAKSSWRLTSIRLGKPAVKQLNDKSEN